MKFAKLLVLIFVLLMPMHAYASMSYTSVQPGNWNDVSTWDSLGVPPNDGTADVEINTSVALDGDINVGSLTINAGGFLSGGYTITASTVTINSGGHIEVDFNMNAQSVTMAAGATYDGYGTVNLASGGVLTNNGATFSAPWGYMQYVIFDGDGTINGSIALGEIDIYGAVDFGIACFVNELEVYTGGSATGHGPKYSGFGELDFYCDYTVGTGDLLWPAGSTSGTIPQYVYVWNSASFTINESRYIADGGIFALYSSGNCTINADLTVLGGGGIDFYNGHSIALNANCKAASFYANAAITGTVTGTITMTDCGYESSYNAQWIVPNLVIDNPADVEIVYANISNCLTIQQGRVYLSNNNNDYNDHLTILPGAKIVQTDPSSNYIYMGNSAPCLQMSVGTTPVVFPIGTANSYTPVTITNGVAGPIDITAGVNGNSYDFYGSLSGNGTNPFGTTNPVLNTWVLSGSPTNATLVFQYPGALRQAGFTQDQAFAARTDGSSMISYRATSTPSADMDTSTLTVTGVNAFSSWGIFWGDDSVFNPGQYVARFSGNSSDYISSDTSDAIAVTTSATIEAMIKPVNTGDTQELLRLHSMNDDDGCEIQIYYDGSVSFNAKMPSGTGGWTSISSSGINIFDDAWHHVAGVVDTSNNLTLYIDGVSQGSNTNGNGPIATNGAGYVYVGMHPNGMNHYSGLIDEVRVSKTARYTATFTPPTSAFVPDTNTLVLYHFNQPSEVSILDASGLGNNGAVHGSILYDTTSVIATGISAAKTGSIPHIFALNQNYPNPFNPSTTISFTLAQNGFTTLKIYDILGREVTTLVNGDRKAGIVNTVTFNASKLSSGVYFSRLASGGSTQIKKLLLLK